METYDGKGTIPNVNREKVRVNLGISNFICFLKRISILKHIYIFFQKIIYRRSFSRIIEHMEFDFVMSRKFGQRNIRVFDIGAHTGEFLDIFSSSNHKHKFEVVCVEPLPQNFKILKWKSLLFRIRNKGTVTILPFGIGNTGVTKFYLGSATTLFTSSSEWAKRFPQEFKRTNEIEIRTFNVKNLIEFYKNINFMNFDLVKIDTEGSDLSILIQLIENKIKFNALIIEFDKTTLKKMIKTLVQSGYPEIYAFVRDGMYTNYIGNIQNDKFILNYILRGRNLCGNLVAFRGP